MSGHVQGVGFRMFAERQAKARAVRGYVRNSPDGQSVDVVAEGPAAALDALLAALRRGPRLARVTTVDVRWLPATGEFDTFQVRE